MLESETSCTPGARLGLGLKAGSNGCEVEGVDNRPVDSRAPDHPDTSDTAQELDQVSTHKWSPEGGESGVTGAGCRPGVTRHSHSRTSGRCRSRGGRVSLSNTSRVQRIGVAAQRRVQLVGHSGAAAGAIVVFQRVVRRVGAGRCERRIGAFSVVANPRQTQRCDNQENSAQYCAHCFTPSLRISTAQRSQRSAAQSECKAGLTVARQFDECHSAVHLLHPLLSAGLIDLALLATHHTDMQQLNSAHR